MLIRRVGLRRGFDRHGAAEQLRPLLHPKKPEPVVPIVTADLAGPKPAAVIVNANKELTIAGGEGYFDIGRVGVHLNIYEPGEYVVYCTVPGHREAGMEGALIVR